MDWPLGVADPISTPAGRQRSVRGGDRATPAAPGGWEGGEGGNTRPTQTNASGDEVGQAGQIFDL